MMIFGIVSEYNPMHNGHIYQIQRIKKQIPDAYVISLTSSSFVQRGEPSFISKHSKSKIAVENGIDLVLEMPTIISIQSANFFSFYSIYLLNKLNILSYISFGVENLSKDMIEDYLNFTKLNQGKIDNLIAKYIKTGLSYKASNIEAYRELGFNHSQILNTPNNTLALQYATSLDKLKSDIKIFPINRNDEGYHEKEIQESIYQSATAIRKAYMDKKNIWPYLPEKSIEFESDINTVDLDAFSKIFYYKAFIEESYPDKIASYENGILNLLKSNFETNISDMVEKSHNKRYSKSRLKRFIINYLLNVTFEDVDNLDKINYIRPLAFNEKGRQILKKIKDNSQIKILNSLSESKDLDKINQRFLEIDEKAFKLYNLNNPERNKLDFTSNPFIKNGV